MNYKTSVSLESNIDNKRRVISTQVKSNILSYVNTGNKIYIFKALLRDAQNSKLDPIKNITYLINHWFDVILKGRMDIPTDLLEINNILSDPNVVIDLNKKVIITTLTGEIPIYIYNTIDRVVVSNQRRYKKSVLLPPASVSEISSMGVLHNKNLLTDLNRAYDVTIRNIEYLSIQLINILRSRLEYIENKSQHPIYISFSGGIDSSLLLKIAYDNGLNVIPITVGLKKSKDIQSMKQSLKELNYKGEYYPIEVSKKDVLESIHELKNNIEVKNPVYLSIACVENLIMKNVRGKILIMGQGADELYGGYDKYRRLYDRYPEENLIDIALLYKGTILIEYIISELNDVTIAYPYLTYLGLLHSNTVPNIFKVSGREDRLRKWVIRRALKILGTSKELYMKRKRAIQYSTGIDKVVKAFISGKEAKY